jgi:hypothetical protein
MFDRLASHGVLHAAAHVGFFSGMGMLLPLITNAWTKHVQPWLYSPYGFYVAIGLIVFSLLIIGFLAGSASKLLKSVGWLVIVPGVLAIMFTAFGQATVGGWAQAHITGFTTVQPLFDVFVAHTVPSTAVVGGMYILIGMSCLWLGGKIKHAASLIG